MLHLEGRGHAPCGEPPSSRRLQAGAPEPRAWGLHWEGDPPPGPPGAAAASVSPLCSGCLVTSEAAVRGSRAFENRVRVGPAGAASVESSSPAVGRKHGSSRRERQRRNPKLPAEPELLWRAPSPQPWLDEAGCGQEKQPLETDIGVRL